MKAKLKSERIAGANVASRKRFCYLIALTSILSGTQSANFSHARGFSYDKPTKNGVDDLPAIASVPIAEPPSREVPPEEGPPKKEPEKPKVEPVEEKPAEVPVFDPPPEQPAEPPPAPPPLELAPAPLPPAASVPTQIENVEPWWNETIQQPISGRGLSAYSFTLENLVWHYLAGRPQIQTFLSQPQPQHDVVIGVSDLNQVIEPIARQDIAPLIGDLSQAKPVSSQEMPLALYYSQPTRVGADVIPDYSSVAAIRLAQGTTPISAIGEVQRQVFEVCQAYWTVFYLRAALVQDIRAMERLESIADQLALHAGVEGTQSLVEKAKSIATQRQDVAKKIETQLSVAESNLKKLVGLDGADNNITFEIVPISLPINQRIDCELNQQLADAFFERPDVRSSCSRIHDALSGQDIDANELRYSLSSLVQAYFRGASGENGMANQAVPQNQPNAFVVSPQRHRNNLAVQSILQVRNLQMRQRLFDLNHQLLLASAEIESALTELEGSLAEYSVAIDSTLATEQRQKFLLERWQRNPAGDGARSALLLEELLNAESQLVQAENAWALTQCTYMISIAKIRCTTGKLISISNPDMNQSNMQTPEMSSNR